MNFTGFAGNERIKSLLAAGLSGGRLPHFILIDGPAGSGRRTLARIIAKALLCRDSGEDRPCGSCVSCMKMEKEIHPDFTELRGKGASGLFPVESIREMRRDLFIVPSESAYKGVLLLDTDTMSPQSQNALLTILEEPPAHAFILLTCLSASSMLPTIRSRATTLSLAPVSETEAEEELLRRGISPEQTAELIRAGGGLIGQMLSLYEDRTRGQARSFCRDLALLLTESQELPLLAACAPLEKDRALCREALPLLRMIFRDALLIKCGGEDRSFPDPEPATALAGKLSAQRLLAMLRRLDEAGLMLERNVHGALFATWLPAALREAAGT